MLGNPTQPLNAEPPSLRIESLGIFMPAPRFAPRATQNGRFPLAQAGSIRVPILTICRGVDMWSAAGGWISGPSVLQVHGCSSGTSTAHEQPQPALINAKCLQLAFQASSDKPFRNPQCAAGPWPAASSSGIASPRQPIDARSCGRGFSGVLTAP